MVVSCVHPVAMLRRVFCIICSMSMLVSDALSSHMVEAYSSSYGFVCCEYGFLLFAPLSRGEDCEYVDRFACFGCGQVYVSGVSESGAKCES